MIYDQTGAGDSFAGGFCGYLYRTEDISLENIKRAVVYGSTMASFCVEQFSTKGLEQLSYLRIQDRYRISSLFRDLMKKIDFFSFKFEDNRLLS